MVEARDGEAWFESFGDQMRNDMARRSWLDNPWTRITLTPEYWGLEGAVLEFTAKLLKGYLWEARNTQHFVAVHSELPEVEAMIARIEWLQKEDEFWPEKDEWIQLLLVDFARLVPKLWD